MKSISFLTILLGLLVFGNGCATKKPTATFNGAAVYEVAPEGLWIADALYDSQPKNRVMKRTGLMWLPPSTMIGAAE